MTSRIRFKALRKIVPWLHKGEKEEEVFGPKSLFLRREKIGRFESTAPKSRCMQLPTHHFECAHCARRRGAPRGGLGKPVCDVNAPRRHQERRDFCTCLVSRTPRNEDDDLLSPARGARLMVISPPSSKIASRFHRAHLPFAQNMWRGNRHQQIFYRMR